MTFPPATFRTPSRVRAAPFEVGFKVIAFGPFIPSVDEHEPILERPVRNGTYHCGQVLGKPIRRPVDDRDRVLATARRVVPTYKDAGIIGELWLPLEHEASRLFIVVNL